MKVSSLVMSAVSAVVLGASAAVAQQPSPIGHGSWLVGGSAGLSRDHANGGSTRTTASLAPVGLYFVAPGLALGGTLNVGYATGVAQGGDSHETVLGVAPTIRYFFGDLADKVFPYLNASVGPAWDRLTIGGGSSDITTRSIDLTGSAGLMDMIVPHVGLSAELYYTARHRSSDREAQSGGTVTVTADNQSYGLRFGINAFVY